jgi:hypothetical protein
VECFGAFVYDVVFFCAMHRVAPKTDLKHFATDYPFDVVDLYDSVTGTWSTASLSVARYYIAATSVGNVALFAGGNTISKLRRHQVGWDG